MDSRNNCGVVVDNPALLIALQIVSCGAVPGRYQPPVIAIGRMAWFVILMEEMFTASSDFCHLGFDQDVPIHIIFDNQSGLDILSKHSDRLFIRQRPRF